jgi:divinyl chlorophyllide a 8-vinyl-reductase
MMTRQVCIAGATGYLGSRLVAQLRARSIPVLAILKNRSCEADQNRLNALGATLAFVDASRIESYAQVLSGAQIAISCMASGNLHVDSTDDFWAIDRDANIRFGLEAVRAGVKHVILVATFEGRDSRRLTEFSNAKESAVDAIGAACRQAGVAFTVIRPTAYFSDLTNRALDSVLKRGRYTVIGDGSHRINPVDGDDVAVFIANCIGNPQMAGREHQVGGPDIFTFREIGLLAAEVIRLPYPLKIRSIPLWSLRFVAAMAAMVGRASPKSRRSAAILRWMIYSSTHDAIAISCGTRRLYDDFCSKRDALRLRIPAVL